MKTKQTLLSIALFLTTLAPIFGQTNDLKIFGYFQNIALHSDVSFDGGNNVYETNTFLMQQMNIMMAKNFGPQFSSFVNLEFTNSFSYNDNIGGFKIEEAWLKYSTSNAFNLKAGTLIPSFNSMNEIKNRTILLPYILRPLAYETVYFKQYGLSEFVPVTANLQVYGEIPVSGDLYFNYALYIGNSATLYNNEKSFSYGQDQTSQKLVGGRLGLEYEDLTLGFSYTSDRKDSTGTTIGFIPRQRMGAYLNYSQFGFDLEAEYIGVTYNLTDANKATLALNPRATQSYDKKFMHVNLLYNFTDNLGAYAGYDYIQGDDNSFIFEGIDQMSYGTVYRVTNAIILKAQYTRQTFTLLARGAAKGLRNDIAIGASVNF